MATLKKSESTRGRNVILIFEYHQTLTAELSCPSLKYLLVAFQWIYRLQLWIESEEVYSVTFGKKYHTMISFGLFKPKSTLLLVDLELSYYQFVALAHLQRHQLPKKSWSYNKMIISWLQLQIQINFEEKWQKPIKPVNLESDLTSLHGLVI